MKFFQPDRNFINWLAKYANNRTVIEVGCGEAHVIFDLSKLGLNTVGIDRFMNTDELWNQIYKEKDSLKTIPKLLAEDIKDEVPSTIISALPNTLILCIRPCHSDFVEYTISRAHPTAEILYITKPENLEKFDDLGIFSDLKELVSHEGSSVDNEVVFSIKREPVCVD